MNSKKNTCDICIETRLLIPCISEVCELNVCKKCLCKYLLESINESQCMSCKKRFDREYLIKHLGISWYDGKYKTSRKNVMFEREKALFSETMPFAEDMKKKEILSLERDNLDEDFLKKEREFLKFKRSYLTQRYKLTQQITRQFNDNNEPKESISKQSKFYSKCPVDNCTGMLNDDNICITCNIKTCKSCFEPLYKEDNDGDEQQHTCDPNTLATIKQLKLDTKPCPKCSTLIHRISGCYQMWCVQCHATFHYRTGELLNETVHNPHYLEWLRNNTNVDIHINPCGQLDYGYFNGIRKYNRIEYNTCINILASITHLRYNQLETARFNHNKFADNNIMRTKRAQYMLKYIDEKSYKQYLFMSYKQTQRWGDIVNLLNMYIDAITSLLVNYVSNKNYENLILQIKNITDYTNSQLDRIRQLYNNSNGFQLRYNYNHDNSFSLKVIR